MRIFLAGATGAVGRRLIPLLVAAGHDVVGTTRRQARAERLAALGAQPVVLDALDAGAVRQAVLAARPDAVVHQMTSIGPMRSLRNFDAEFAATNRLRDEGTRYLLSAARSAEARLFLAQSFTGWPNERQGTRVKSESDPLDPHPPASMARTLGAIRALEQMVSEASGLIAIVLRYGYFYGPGTSISDSGDIVTMVRHRQFPIIGDGSGVWSFTHIDDAANATLVALERGIPGTFNIVDDEPAEVSLWLPELAQAVGAKPPYHLPAWLGNLAAGEAAVSMMTRIRGSSNAKARRLLGWTPRYPSWREGFQRGLEDRRLADRGGIGGLFEAGQREVRGVRVRDVRDVRR
jgi:nucleoside-diphosphate-sugar epimerase